jgi:hypothetical protein
MNLDLPFWCRQRQAKVEELSTGRYKITGPNLPEAVVSVRIGDDLQWQAVLQNKADGPEVDATGFEFANARDALAAAFELYRRQVIV